MRVAECLPAQYYRQNPHDSWIYFLLVLLVHPFLIVVPRYYESGVDPTEAFFTITTTFNFVGIILGICAWFLMLILGATSLFRKTLLLRQWPSINLKDWYRSILSANQIQRGKAETGYKCIFSIFIRPRSDSVHHVLRHRDVYQPRQTTFLLMSPVEEPTRLHQCSL